MKIGDCVKWFQSSSCPKTGCASATAAQLHAHTARFNPHPARRQDAPASAVVPGRRYTVFQSSSCPKTGCASIPSQSPMAAMSFNPHPARRQDAPQARLVVLSVSSLFQSSSCPKTGCADPLSAYQCREQIVSILILPEDRMRHCGDWRQCDAEPRFNPHPARRQDAPPRGPRNRSGPLCFNPHPARRQDAPCFQARCTSGVIEFQSSSCPKTGCAGIVLHHQGERHGVSILILPEDRMRRMPFI